MESPTGPNFASPGTLPYLADAAPRQLPAQLGRYKLLEQIGAGGMGVVFKALHVGLKRTVALKVLNTNLVGAADFSARFHREIEALGRLDHPNVVRATDGGEEAGMLFLVMDFVEGKDLDRLVKTLGPLETVQACELIRQAAVGLDYIHRRGLIHRDIKPSNLFLSNEGIVKILDLGLARLLEHEGNAGEELTPTGIAMGTADYLAPEQAQDSSRVDIRADIYSLGCSLFKLLSGRPPFSGPRFASMAQKIWGHAHTPLPPCESIHPLPTGLLAVLHKMTAKDPAQRQATPGEVAEALRPFADCSDLLRLLTKAEDEPTTAPPTTSGARLAESTPPDGLSETKEGPSTLQQPQVSRKRGGWLLWAAALILLLGTALSIYLAVSFWGKVSDRKAEHPLELTANLNSPTRLALEKPDTPAPLRCLDGLTPLRWHDLLDQEPTVGLWFPGEGLASWKLDRDLHQLTVSADRDALLHLGTLKQPNYSYQIAIAQPRWTGGVGIYLGYREIAPLVMPPGEDTPVAQFQLLYIQRRVKAGVEGYLMTRGRGTILRAASGQTQAQTHLVTSQELPALFGEQVLEVTVTNSRMRRVRFGGVDLPNLVQDEVNDKFTPQDYSGCLGTLNAASSAVFRNARFMIHAGF